MHAELQDRITKGQLKHIYDSSCVPEVLHTEMYIRDSECHWTMNLLVTLVVVRSVSEILTIMICGSRSLYAGRWIQFRCFNHHHNDYCTPEIIFLLFWDSAWCLYVCWLARHSCGRSTDALQRLRLHVRPQPINKPFLPLASNLLSPSSTEPLHSNSSNLQLETIWLDMHLQHPIQSV